MTILLRKATIDDYSGLTLPHPPLSFLKWGALIFLDHPIALQWESLMRRAGLPEEGCYMLISESPGN